MSDQASDQTSDRAGDQIDANPRPDQEGDAPGDDETISRVLEAMLFAAKVPLELSALSARFSSSADIGGLLSELQARYRGRGVELTNLGGRWAFRTNPELAPYLRQEREETRRPSRAAIETLAVVAYHQPVTRADIEEIRGVALSKGTLDMLLEAGWIKPCGRRQTVGRPLQWGTTDAFLDHFSLGSLEDLPGVEELKAAGLLDARPALAAYGARGQLGEDALADVEDDGVLTGQAGKNEVVQLDLLRPEPKDAEGE